MRFKELPNEVRRKLELNHDSKNHAHECETCGHIWCHPTVDKPVFPSFADVQANERAHRCPSCNSGPYWYHHYSDDGGHGCAIAQSVWNGRSLKTKLNPRDDDKAA